MLKTRFKLRGKILPLNDPSLFPLFLAILSAIQVAHHGHIIRPKSMIPMMKTLQLGPKDMVSINISSLVPQTRNYYTL